MDHHPDIDRLLVKYLLGEASAEEYQQVEQWLAQDPGNQPYFDGFRKIWETSGNLAPAQSIDAQDAWERFETSSHFPVEKGMVIPMHPRSSSLRKILSIAALFLTMIGGAWIWWYMGRQQPLLSIKTEAATLTDTLPDGSQVTLNKYSALTYPQQFKGGQRLVKLEGEGFFHVAPDQSHPFQVEVNGVTVLVLGTSFNIRSKAGRTEVIVETGKVAVESGGQKTEVEPGEQVAVSADHTGLVKTETEGELYQYYRTKKFICHNTPLWKLAEVLNEAYDVHIAVLGQDVRNLELTTTFSNEPLDSILDVVTQTLNLHQTRVGKNIILK